MHGEYPDPMAEMVDMEEMGKQVSKGLRAAQDQEVVKEDAVPQVQQVQKG